MFKLFTFFFDEFIHRTVRNIDDDRNFEKQITGFEHNIDLGNLAINR